MGRLMRAFVLSLALAACSAGPTVGLVLAACSSSAENDLLTPDARSEPTYDVDVTFQISDSVVVTFNGAPVVNGDVVTFDYQTATELVNFTATARVDFGDMAVEWPLQSVCQRDLERPAAEHRQFRARRGNELCDSIVESAICDYTDGTSAEWSYDPCE